MKLKELYDKIVNEHELLSSIKETRPIKVSVHNTLSNEYFVVRVPALSMKKETFDQLSSEHDKIIGGQYNTRNGSTEFFAYSKEDLNEWLNKYKDIVKV